MDLHTVALKDNEWIKVHGRTVQDRDPVKLIWTGSAIELNVKCSELYIELESCYVDYENWISIMINGSFIARQMLKKEKEWIPVFRMRNPEKVTNVRIIKDVQAMSCDPEHCINVYAVKLDGEILPVEDRPLKIEFIGDSITSGEGTIGTGPDEDWISMFFCHPFSYPYLVAKKMNADYRVLSQSGWGVYASWDNNPSSALPPYYEEICGLAMGDEFKKLGFLEKNDFASWQPDFICVNLGTNDDGAFHNEAFKDPDTGKVYKLHMEGENYVREDIIKVRDAVTNFLKTLRKNNPKARICWCFGILGDAMAPVIQEGIDFYQKESGDEKIDFITLPNTDENTVGSRMHPGYYAHLAAAEAIVAAIKEYIL